MIMRPEGHSSLKELIGKTVSEVHLDSGNQSLLMFVLHDGETIYYEALGDCCSESWFSDGTNIQALLGGTVVSVDELEEKTVTDDRMRQDVDILYGYAIRTDKGTATINFRNSSNGYYGGSCVLVEKSPRLNTELLKPIQDDWSI